MTKSDEYGENDFTRDAKRQAKRSGEDVCSILAKWLSSARAKGDEEEARRLIKAQKYLGCRNVQKRRK